MRFDVLTLFPEAFAAFTGHSIIGRAVERGLISVHCHDIRDYSTLRHRQVDDVPYGGGPGMVMMCEPIFKAVEAVQAMGEAPAPVVYLTPQGQPWAQPEAETWAAGDRGERMIILCGHYEGVDYRVREALVQHEYRIGDYVLTGGELPAQVLMDSVARLRPGVVGTAESVAEESFSVALDRKREYPHYTRPAEYAGMAVPDVLLSGHHAKIEAWRRGQCRS